MFKYLENKIGLNMTEEEKRLLIIDLCMRLPYGVNCGILTHPSYRLPNWKKENDLWYKGRLEWHKLDIKTLSINPIDCFYPYLRPMESMTEAEKKELLLLQKEQCDSEGAHLLGCECGYVVHYNWMQKCLDFLNEHHLDYRNLIGKGLALPAPEGMYNIK